MQIQSRSSGVYRSQVARAGSRKTIIPFASAAVAGVTPVAFDAGTNGGALTFSHTCTGTNRYLVVEISLGTGTDTISGITYNGVAMTQLRRTSGGFGSELWGLVNPASGANNVVITRGTGTGGLARGATSFRNVDQTTPIESGSAGGSAGSGITTLNGPSQTTNVGGMVVESIASNSVTPTGSTQQGWNDGGGDGGFYLVGTGSAQQTSYTITSGNYALASVALNAVGSVGSGVAYTDAATPLVTLTPSSVDVHEIPDANTVPVLITASAAEIHEITDSATPIVTITPGVATVSAGVVVTDTATRTITAASNQPWGTTDSGHTWVVGSPFFAANATVMGVNGSQLTMVMIATSTNRRSQGIVSVGTDVEILAKIGMAALPSGSNFSGMVAGRLSDSSNYYEARLSLLNTGVVNLKLTVRVAGVETTPTGGATATIDSSYTGAEFYWVKFNINGSTLSAKAWKSGTSEPGAWTVQSTDTQLTTGTNVMMLGLGTSGTTADGTLLVDEFDATQLNVSGAPGEIAQFVDTATARVTLTPSATETQISGAVDAATAGVVITPSSSDIAAYIDANTPILTITPSSIDVAAVTEAVTVPVLLTVSATEGAQFVDAATTRVTVTPVTTFEGIQVSDAATIPVVLTASATEAQQFTEAATVPVTLTPTTVETREEADAATASVVITPSALDVVPNSDTATILVLFTPTTVETAQFSDTATVPVLVNSSATTEARVSTDSATASVILTISAIEGAQFAESATVTVLLSPSFVESTQFADAVSVGVTISPSSTDTAQDVESATTPITITPSAVEVYGRTLTDTGAVPIKLTNSALESAQFGDAGAVPVVFTTSGSEVQIAGTFETGTASVLITPSSIDPLDVVESATVPIKMTVTSTDVPERAFLDSGTVPIALTPITTFEDIIKSDGGECYLTVTPFTLSEFQSDGDIVPLHITSALAEIFVHEDTNVILLDLMTFGVESASLTTTGDVYFHITPAIAEVFAGVDQATILVSITPGVVFEVQQVADYLLVGVVSNKWTAILRDNTYAGTLHATRYVLVGLDTRWHYHYRGRGDE